MRLLPGKTAIRRLGLFLWAGIVVMATNHVPAIAETAVFTAVTDIELPVEQGAREPSLFAMENGRIAMSWTEPAGEGFAVKVASHDGTTWTDPRIAVISDRLFVNWADFPTIAALADGTLAVHWLRENGRSSYAYDVNIALSSDDGRTWSEVLVPHRDGSQEQHGFVSLLPVAPDRMIAIWLDGRGYSTIAQDDDFGSTMQLRATIVGSDGSLSEDVLLDASTCSCCQTSAAVTDDGTVLVAYRDRSNEEVRDISIVRRIDGIWSDPKTVHSDGWEISGCPVNGPAIDADGDRVVVAWFTAANDIPAVNVAFSKDTGVIFSDATRIDRGDGAGRVDALQLSDGSALVSWVEWTDEGEALLVCRARPVSGCGDAQTIALNNAAGSINFPRMALARDGVYIAWTQPLAGPSAGPELDTTIRMVLARF